MTQQTPAAPDFARMYGGDTSLLSPRMAELLWSTALLLAELSEEEDFLERLRDQMPLVVQRVADDVWMARFTNCFRALASRLASGHQDLARLASCTGEEMALHLMIETAESGVDDGSIRVDESLPADEDRDHDFVWAREILFRDHDVLLLFDHSFDGIEDTESELSQRFRVANLHPNR